MAFPIAASHGLDANGTAMNLSQQILYQITQHTVYYEGIIRFRLNAPSAL